MVQIYVDALADLSESYKDIKVLPYLFDIDGKKYLTSDLSSKDVYDYMSKGTYPKTSRPNLGVWSDMIEEDLKAGKDILYLPNRNVEFAFLCKLWLLHMSYSYYQK